MNSVNSLTPCWSPERKQKLYFRKQESLFTLQIVIFLQQHEEEGKGAKDDSEDEDSEDDDSLIIWMMMKFP